jgi:hypothetical protein
MAATFARFDPTPFVGGDVAENAISLPTPAKVAKAAKVETREERFSRFSDFSSPTPTELKNVDVAAPDDDDAEERAAILEYDAHLPRHEAERLAGVPPADDGPHEPCPKCGWRTFWRRSMTRNPWQCCGCVAVPRNVWTDCTALPPKAGAP